MHAGALKQACRCWVVPELPRLLLQGLLLGGAHRPPAQHPLHCARRLRASGACAVLPLSPSSPHHPQITGCPPVYGVGWSQPACDLVHDLLIFCCVARLPQRLRQWGPSIGAQAQGRGDGSAAQWCRCCCMPNSAAAAASAAAVGTGHVVAVRGTSDPLRLSHHSLCCCLTAFLPHCHCCCWLWRNTRTSVVV